MPLTIRGVFVRRKGFILEVGSVDVDYKTQQFSVVDGKRKLLWICPFYEKWKQMIYRCYSPKEKLKKVGYLEATCCDEWLSLSVFKSWMEQQQFIDNDGNIMHLDKDTLVKGNKCYSPKTCVFLHHKVNCFIFSDGFYSSSPKLGVTYHKCSGKYQAQCNDPFGIRPRALGLFIDSDSAHMAYIETKHQYACELASSKYVTDHRVADVLINMFNKTT